MEPIRDLDRLLRNLEPALHPGSYAFISVTELRALDPASVVATIREEEGLSVIAVADAAIDAGCVPEFVCAWITLSVPSDLQAVGLTAAVATALSGAGISCNVVAGARHDHVFVPEALGRDAMDVLRALQRGHGAHAETPGARAHAWRGGRASPEVREARAGDVGGVAALLDELGYPGRVEALAARLERLRGCGGEVLVADRDQSLIGLATVHVTPVLHRPDPVGRLTALIVTAAARGQGVGRALVAAAETLLSSRGCGLVEVTSNRRRTDAHAFYARLGYEVTSLRFKKDLSRAGS